MITHWKLKNFKSVVDRDLEFGPLTVFAGKNSSGKSTIIQSILLAAQTSSFEGKPESMILKGKFADLGQFSDIISENKKSDLITIEWTCKPSNSLRVSDSQYNSPKEVNCMVSFGVATADSSDKVLQLTPQILKTKLVSMTRSENDIDRKSEMSAIFNESIISSLTNIYPDIENNEYFKRIFAYGIDFGSDESKILSSIRQFFEVIQVGCSYNHFLPEMLVYLIDTQKNIANQYYDILTSDVTTTNNSSSKTFGSIENKELYLTEKLIQLLSELLGEIKNFKKIMLETTKHVYTEGSSINIFEWLETLSAAYPNELKEIQSILTNTPNLDNKIYSAIKDANNVKLAHSVEDPPELIKDSSAYLKNFFKNLRYLGPLREAPKSLYPHPTIEPDEVGISGERTIYIIEQYKNTQIQYVPTVNFLDSNVDRKIVTATFEEAVVDWLNYFEMAHNIESFTESKHGQEFSIEVNKSENSRDLTHVGVGVSQVLPILVMGLLAKSGSTLIFEQPEIHLHPRVQSRMTDFFLSLTFCSKQCIVETHSEHLINHIRFRAARAAPNNAIQQLAKVYFVEKKAGEESTFREIEIDEYGAIRDWPTDFFDQSYIHSQEIVAGSFEKQRLLREDKKSD